jgi:serine/threonine protein kinase
MTQNPSPVDEALAQELGAEFDIERILGEGGQARVYLARERALQRAVAIKVLQPSLAADEVARKRFQREGRSSARIQHRNVAGVHRVGALSDGVPFLVMEYIEGHTLAEELEMAGPMDPTAARDVLVQVASALEAAHAKGIVHRDVRPGNVIRERGTGRVVLTDFGLAAVMAQSGTAVTRLTQAGELLGDPRHLSPEELRGESAVEESDVYALGVMAYELLTGDGPYPGLSGVQLVSAHLRTPAASLAALRPGVPNDLADIVEKCLSKAAERRPSASTVARRLRGERTDRDMAAMEAKPPGAVAGFLWELRRRRVYQVAVAYLGLAFVTLEGASIVWDSLPVPDWMFDVLVWVALAGFPLSLVLAWVYDLTRTGIRRTEAASGGAGGSSRAWQRALQIAGLAVGLGLAAMLGLWFLGR